MEAYFLLSIPLVCLSIAIICTKCFKWWYYPALLSVCSLSIFLTQVCMEKVETSDVEYLGSLGVRAVHYEPWETHVHKTCTRTYSCNCSTDSKGHSSCQTCTETYDCSYCDYHPEKYGIINDFNESYSISRSFYNQLVKRWKNEQFQELNRSINYSGGCGQDGNMYYSDWNNDPLQSEGIVKFHTYENRTQAAHSVFKFNDISKKEALRLGLYNYPSFYGDGGYKQNVVLGIDSIKITEAQKLAIERRFQYLNATLGPKKQVKIFVLLFYNKDLSIALEQRDYWKGGNKNEMVICIGLDKSLKLQWVYPFSWTDETRIHVDIREDLMEQKVLDFNWLFHYLEKEVNDKWSRKRFRDFKHISIELNSAGWWIDSVLILIFTGIMCFIIINEEK